MDARPTTLQTTELFCVETLFGGEDNAVNCVIVELDSKEDEAVTVGILSGSACHETLEMRVYAPTEDVIDSCNVTPYSSSDQTGPSF